MYTCSTEGGCVVVLFLIASWVFFFSDGSANNASGKPAGKSLDRMEASSIFKEKKKNPYEGETRHHKEHVFITYDEMHAYKIISRRPLRTTEIFGHGNAP
jgi:hypothetical protein